jgi:hypothetical protein
VKDRFKEEVAKLILHNVTAIYTEDMTPEKLFKMDVPMLFE